MISKQILAAGFPFLLALLLANPKVSMSQEIPREISTGDVVPGIRLEKVLNYKTNSISLPDFKEKLLIIDFWATWCGPCVSAFPKLDSLQKEFNNDIQILPVTAEAEATVSTFFDQMRKLNRIVPPSVVGDNVLNRLFRHTYLPHCVWIDGNGKVLAITEGKEITRENIKNAISGKGFAHKEKKDVRNVVDESSEGIPVISPGFKIKTNGRTEFTKMSDSLLYIQTALTQSIEGLLPGSVQDSGMVGVWNSPIVWLYKVALWKHTADMLSEQKTIVEVADPELYQVITAFTKEGKRVASPGLEYLAWLKNNGYCYQLKVPELMYDQKFDIMVDDLNRYFGAKYRIEGRLEKRMAPCLALVRTSNNEKFAAKAPGKPQIEQTKLSIQLSNYKFDWLLDNLGQPLQEQPALVNETGYDGRIDMEINCDLSDLEALNKELAKYDLKFVKKNIEQEIGVIRAKGDSRNVKR